MMDFSLPVLGIIGIGLFFLLMFLKMHVGISMMIAGVVGITLSRGFPAAMSTLSTTVYRVSSSEYLAVIPLFVLMGILAGSGGISREAFSTFNKWVGHLSGGLAMATVATCAAFGAVCGDNIATASTMFKAALPEMRRYGYSDQLSMGAIACGGNLGILIPPSTAFVVYGFVTQSSIGALFIAGIVPGILLTLMFMGQIYIQCKIKPNLAQLQPAVPWKERIISLKGIVGIILVFVIVMGGLLGGLFTPSEAGAVGSVAIIVISLIYRQLSLKNIGKGLMEAVKICAMILLLVFGAQTFSHFLTTTEIAPAISNWILNSGLNMYAIMFAIVILYLILGCFMDIWSIMIITLPIFFPLVTDLGFDPLQFGVLVVLCIMAGCVTPPVGVVVFTLSGMVKDVPMYDIFKGVYPFLATMVICMVIIVFFPILSTWLPDLMIPYR
jgi:tripartite ATP-independent transporter DctM subunit